MSANLIDKTKATQATRDESARELESLHLEMLDQMAGAVPDGWSRKTYGLDLLRGSFEAVNVVAPTAEFLLEALCLYGKVAALFPPKYGETPRVHAARVHDWIVTRWRAER